LASCTLETMWSQPPLLRSRRAPHCGPVGGRGGRSPRRRGPTGGRGGRNPHCRSPAGGRGGPSPHCRGPTGRKGMPCLSRLLISIDFDCFRVLFVVGFSKLNFLLIADCYQLHAGKYNFYVILLFLIISILITKCTHSYIFRFTC
jgi:hypothetical protein